MLLSRNTNSLSEPIATNDTQDRETMHFHKLNFFLPLLMLLIQSGVCIAQDAILIEPAKKKQNMFGFGSGMVFYADNLMKGLPEEEQPIVYDWLWTDVEMNLLMFQLRYGVEEVNDNDDPSVLDRDKLNYKIIDRQARLMKEAKKRRGEKMTFIATLYTPPAWLKDNGKVKGGGVDTSKDSNFLEMAEFIYAWLDRLKTKHGIDVEYLTLANEPDWNHKQPGAKWSSRDLAKATDLSVNHLRKLIDKTDGMVMPKIIAANTLSVRSARRYAEAIVANRGARKNLDVIGFHLYDSGTKESDYKKLRKFDVPLWMTEWTGPRNLSKKIKSPLTHSMGQMVGRIEAMHGGAGVIMHFELGHPNHYTAGIFKANWKKPWVRDTPYYVWQQMVNRTPQGPDAFMVKSSVSKGDSATENRVAAFTDKKKNQSTIHLINDSKDPVKGRTISFLRREVKSVEVYRTSESENHEQLKKDAVQFNTDSITIDLPAWSFTTLKVQH